MKAALFLTATLFTGVLSAPVARTLVVRHEILEERRLPIYATPRIGVTAPSKRDPASHINRSINIRHDLNLIGLVDRAAEKIKARCDEIESIIKATNNGILSKDRAARRAVRKMNGIRATLSRTVSVLNRTPTLRLTPQGRQLVLNPVYAITSELHKTIRNTASTLGPSGARSMSRASHMLTDVLGNIVIVNPDIASDMYKKLAPIFSNDVAVDEGDLSVFVMSSVKGFIASIADDLNSEDNRNSGDDCIKGERAELK
ncbi:hypothetical protein FBEOM_3745 [Fusarium beomiforme]|uniref:Uncharacterized protein n=1 Tax=Fusarium beomiforme TaxID=44412 RepID=A0A9P5APJ5_9HYPO|nr:hypothetical protein FBEOM_3745 [Fusarium beomiforme]